MQTAKRSKKTKTKKRTKRMTGGNKTRVKKCMDTKCKLWLEEEEVNVNKLKKVFENKYKENEKREKKFAGIQRNRCSVKI